MLLFFSHVERKVINKQLFATSSWPINYLIGTQTHQNKKNKMTEKLKTSGTHH